MFRYDPKKKSRPKTPKGYDSSGTYRSSIDAMERSWELQEKGYGTQTLKGYDERGTYYKVYKTKKKKKRY